MGFNFCNLDHALNLSTIEAISEEKQRYIIPKFSYMIKMYTRIRC